MTVPLQPSTFTPECPKCHQPMRWHSVQKQGTQETNVFHCAACDRLHAVTAS
jgi:hypothetical protein